jgi:two-component system chemotaxis response regulator CheY
MKILTVDDSRMMRNLVRNTIVKFPEFTGAEIVEAANGVDALELVNAGDIDIVFSDWNMAEMTGIELLRSIKRSPATAKIPVIMVTSEASPVNEQEALASGASEYIVKPWDDDDFYERVQEAIEE